MLCASDGAFDRWFIFSASFQQAAEPAGWVCGDCNGRLPKPASFSFPPVLVRYTSSILTFDRLFKLNSPVYSPTAISPTVSSSFFSFFYLANSCRPVTTIELAKTPLNFRELET